MACVHKYKYRVTALNFIAFCFITLAFQNTASAIGLSDIVVHSSLGEPLKADITILGAQDFTDASCLKLGSDSDISHVNFKLSSANNDAKVGLTTNKILNEPIINLSVVAGCGNSIERHYVLLLDPPFITQSRHTKNSRAETKAANKQNDSVVKPSVVQRPTKKSKPSTIRKAKKKKARTKKLTRPQNKKPKPSSQAMTKPSETNEITGNLNNTARSDKPTLSISGGDSAPYSFDNTRLRLDRNLVLTPNTNLASVVAEDIMVDDELTAVNNRIAHLQKQITSLEQQNLKLTSDNKFTSKQLSQTKSLETKFRNILLFLCAILLLVLAYIVFGWLRRKQMENQAKPLWPGVNKPEPYISKAKAEKADNADLSQKKKKEVLENDLLPPLPAGTKEEPIVIEDEQAFSILDHADVFLFHGRAALAIQLLQNYLVDHPKQSVTIWLFLLDLLAKEDIKDQYEAASASCKLHYNIKIPDFSQQGTEATESLEDFPRLTQGLCDVWETPDALIYLDDLIYNSRPTPRTGLPRNIIEELAILKAISLEKENPTDAPPTDPSPTEPSPTEPPPSDQKDLKEAVVIKAEKPTHKKDTALEFTLPDKD